MIRTATAATAATTAMAARLAALLDVSAHPTCKAYNRPAAQAVRIIFFFSISSRFLWLLSAAHRGNRTPVAPRLQHVAHPSPSARTTFSCALPFARSGRLPVFPGCRRYRQVPSVRCIRSSFAHPARFSRGKFVYLAAVPFGMRCKYTKKFATCKLMFKKCRQ